MNECSSGLRILGEALDLAGGTLEQTFPLTVK